MDNVSTERRALSQKKSPNLGKGTFPEHVSYSFLRYLVNIMTKVSKETQKLTLALIRIGFSASVYLQS